MKTQGAAEYRRDGVAAWSPDSMDDCVSFLREQADSLRHGNGKIRPWQLWELHNPWGRAAAGVDSWGFLDLCQSEALLEGISALIGEDIILYDSQFLPDSGSRQAPGGAWTNDSLRCPTEPATGLVARIAFDSRPGEAMTFICPAGSHRNPDARREKRINIEPGKIICHDSRLCYRLDGEPRPVRPVEYIIRYFPASARYVRDPGAKIYRDLTERHPLLNYARMPLWLVRGQDRADNDFVTGFQSRAGRWIDGAALSPPGSPGQPTAMGGFSASRGADQSSSSLMETNIRQHKNRMAKRNADC